METAKEKGQKIIDALKALNMEQRGHEIISCLDEEPCEVGVTNMNVPSTADCRKIAEDYHVTFYVDNSWGVGTFEIE